MGHISVKQGGIILINTTYTEKSIPRIN